MSGGAGRAARSAVAAVSVVVLALTATACGGRPTTHHKPGTSHQEASGTGTLLDTRDEQGHRYRQVPRKGAPDVTLTAKRDSEDGWNLRLSVPHFRFTPDSVGGAAVPGRGHAHLLLDGRKVARVYGAWFHLPAGLVRDGERRVTARLYADDHTVWAVAGKPVQGSAALTATAPGPDPDHGDGGHDGQDGQDNAGDTPDKSGTPDAAPVDERVDLTVEDGRVEPPPGRTELKKGQRVQLRVRSDRDDTLHVHGYDREAALRAGRTSTLTLTVDRTGLFEVETHASGLVLTQLVVR